MEVIKQIPVYETPLWIPILGLVSFVVLLFAFAVLHDTEYVGGIIACIALIGILLSVIGAIFLDHSELKGYNYVVRITDMSANEFLEKYTVIKHYPYSDVFQVEENKPEK